jgi:hypothetical protein
MDQPDPAHVFDSIRPFALRLDITPTTGEDLEGWTGTCFVFAKRAKTGQLFCATAKHCLPLDRPAKWAVQRFKLDGSVDFQAIFLTDPSHLGHSYGAAKKIDVGWFLLPPQYSKAFFPNDRLPALIEYREAISEGSQVAWCGYPRQVEMHLGRPRLSYFSGSISTIIFGGEDRRYLMDGHVGHGVSGGPVWYWSKERGRAEIAGIITRYVSEVAEVPGFCVVEWIQPLQEFIGWWQRMASLPPDHPERAGKGGIKLPYELG